MYNTRKSNDYIINRKDFCNCVQFPLIPIYISSSYFSCPRTLMGLGGRKNFIILNYTLIIADYTTIAPGSTCALAHIHEKGM